MNPASRPTQYRRTLRLSRKIPPPTPTRRIPHTSAWGIADGSLNHPSLNASGEPVVGSRAESATVSATVSGKVAAGTLSAGVTPAGAVVGAGPTVSTTVAEPSSGSVSTVPPSPAPGATGTAAVRASDFSGTSSEWTTIRLLAEYRGVHDTRVSVAFVTSVVGITRL